MARGKKGKDEDGKPNPVDIHVGGRVRLRRTLLGMSQEKLGDALGLTYQQVQKYERGASRIGASRLYTLSKILNVPVTFFFEDLGGGLPAARGFSDTVQEPFDHRDPMTLDLIRAFHRISDPKLRKQIVEMAKAMANASGTGQSKSKAKSRR